MVGGSVSDLEADLASHFLFTFGSFKSESHGLRFVCSLQLFEAWELVLQLLFSMLPVLRKNWKENGRTPSGTPQVTSIPRTICLVTYLPR